ncbi:hypothetical protein T484DRAFT_1753091 [Baffinella frigidus]|nr:hypothetical protein T484DRAFT_1753091 [Cryptophyta sp. CCMP2293]
MDHQDPPYTRSGASTRTQNSALRGPTNRPRPHGAKSVTWDTHRYVRSIPARTLQPRAGLSAEVLTKALNKVLARATVECRKTVSWDTHMYIRAIPARDAEDVCIAASVAAVSAEEDEVWAWLPAQTGPSRETTKKGRKE